MTLRSLTLKVCHGHSSKLSKSTMRWICGIILTPLLWVFHTYCIIRKFHLKVSDLEMSSSHSSNLSKPLMRCICDINLACLAISILKLLWSQASMTLRSPTLNKQVKVTYELVQTRVWTLCDKSLADVVPSVMELLQSQGCNARTDARTAFLSLPTGDKKYHLWYII